LSRSLKIEWQNSGQFSHAVANPLHRIEFHA
jgi:hypothetical protein